MLTASNIGCCAAADAAESPCRPITYSDHCPSWQPLPPIEGNVQSAIARTDGAASAKGSKAFRCHRRLSLQ